MSSLPRSITIFLTEECNLNCSYCYSGYKKNNRVIDLEFAKIGIHQTFEKENVNQLRIFGVGEPTLAFKEMQEIVAYAKEIASSNLSVELQTNGYFTREVRNWIAENVDIVWISCDGPPEYHDRYRPTTEGDPSSSVIVENIHYLSQSHKCKLGVRSTVTKHTSKQQSEFVHFFYTLGVKYICADPVFLPVGHDGTDVNVRELLLPDPILYAKDFLKARETAYSLGVTYDSIFTVNVGDKHNYGCRGCYTNPHLTVDGYVTCCDMAFSGNTPLKEMVWGKYDPLKKEIVYNSRNVRNVLNRRVENLPTCNSCEWKYQCSGGCFGEALNESGHLYGIKTFSCQATRYILSNLEQPVFSILGHP